VHGKKERTKENKKREKNRNYYETSVNNIPTMVQALRIILFQPAQSMFHQCSKVVSNRT
jgi:hypothetical protein